MNDTLQCVLLALRVWLGLLLLVAGVLVPGGRAGATPLETAGLPAESGWQWAASEHFEWPTAVLDVRTFTAPHGLARTAAHLARRMGQRFDRIQFARNGLQLSGLRQGQHWLAHLQPAISGTHGVLSILSPRPAPRMPYSLSGHVPAACTAVLRISTRASAGQEQLVSYRCPGSMQKAIRQVHTSLLAHGWRRHPAEPDATSPVHGDPGAEGGFGRSTDWQHPHVKASLTLLIRALGQDVALVFWLRPEGS